MSRLSKLVLSIGPGEHALDPTRSPHPILPDISDLSGRVRFVPTEGQVWLDDQRVVMLNLEALTTLRREIIEAVGPRKAQEMYFRAGHAAGAREAAIALKMRTDTPLNSFLVGPQLHALRGEVLVEPDILEGSVESGRYYSELTWRNSAEAESHLNSFGGSSDPVCWMQCGYASGYTSSLMERPVIFKEIECVACGSTKCRIVGKPAEEWPDLEGTAFVHQPEVPLNKTASDTTLGVQHDGIVGASPRFLAAWHLLNKVAPLRTTVLLLGETGVGKEVFARALHNASPRSGRPMISINCAAIPESLIDSELFGSEKGAFTSSIQSRPGWFEVADGSTLFLDEVGTLSLPAQAKLLRVLQEGEFTRVGATSTRKVDTRIICATNVDLEEEVKQGKFRMDLLHRLNTFPIAVPPLRERRSDIPPLIDFFLKRFNERNDRKIGGFTISAVDAMLFYDFPGNVRELENMIERAAIMTNDNEPIDTFHLFSKQNGLHRTLLSPQANGALTESDQSANAPPKTVSSLLSKMSLVEIENLAVSEALKTTKGNVSKAAQLLGMTRSQLRVRIVNLKKYTSVVGKHAEQLDK